MGLGVLVRLVGIVVGVASALQPRRLDAASALEPSRPSRFFLDTAEQSAWDELLPTGLFHGVTMNPTLLERANLRCDIMTVSRLVKHAVSDHGMHEVMVQAWGGSVDTFESSALGVLSICSDSREVVIKLPLTRDGIVAGRRLIDQRVKVCMTACYGRHQALTAGALGADYVAPYLGRMTDTLDKDGLAECVAMEGALRAMGTSTRLLVASLRDVDTLFKVAAEGSDATFSPTVARALLTYAPTEEAAQVFEFAVETSLLGD